MCVFSLGASKKPVIPAKAGIQSVDATGSRFRDGDVTEVFEGALGGIHSEPASTRSAGGSIRFSKVSAFFGIPLRPVVGLDGQTRWGIPMQAEALMRMQSPVLATDLPNKASLEQPQDGPGAASPGGGNLEPMPDPEAPPPDHICNAGTEPRPAP